MLGHQWQAVISSRVNGRGCPYCSNKKVLSGFNDLMTLSPELCKEWNFQKNKNISPETVTVYSHKKVWWKDSLEHEWKATVANRTNGNGCPFCNGKSVLSGFNDLLSKNPKLASEWDYDKNGFLTPEDVTYSSNKRVWWKCSRGHSWSAAVAHRNNTGCPYCTGKKAWPGFNDLQTTHPKLASEWDFEKNKITPANVTFGSNKQYWWKCRRGHSYSASVLKRRQGHGCPYCCGRKVYPGFNDLKSIAPWILKEWDYERNQNITPDKNAPFSTQKVWWKCNNGHHWRSSVNSRENGWGCPYCSGMITYRRHILP